MREMIQDSLGKAKDAPAARQEHDHRTGCRARVRRLTYDYVFRCSYESLPVTPLDPIEAEAVATLFRVLGDATRCRIVSTLLGGDEICVGDLAVAVGMSESSVSHHLAVLRAHRLVRHRRVGRQVHYAPDDEHIRQLFDITRDHVAPDDALARRP